MFEIRVIKKRARRAHVWSNVFFLAPIMLACAASLLWYGVLLGVMMLVSFWFHISKEKDWGVSWLSKPVKTNDWVTQRLLWLDTVMGFAVMVASMQLLASTGFIGGFVWLAMIAGIVAVLVFLAEFYKPIRDFVGYSWSHAAWHFWAAVTALLSVLAAGTAL